MQDKYSSRRQFLHSTLGTGLALAGNATLLSVLAGCAQQNTNKVLTQSLRLVPVADATTARNLLELPEGFRYFSFGWAGDRLSGGDICPGAHDGMGIVEAEGDRLTLIRNHEITQDTGAFSNQIPIYDPGAAGGTVTLSLDMQQEKLLEARASLSGTCYNCSGGVTPWGSWLSCEEQVRVEGELLKRRDGSGADRFQRTHGFVFEVPAAGASDAIALPALGCFRHEGVAVDPNTGILYLTEDRNPASGLYRFLPESAGNLKSGRLQMLRAVGAPDLRGAQAAGVRYKTAWVDIRDPGKGHAVMGDYGGVVAQGIAAGGSVFPRLEGVFIRGRDLYFTSTSGGAAGAGQVWVYRPDQAELELVYESPDVETMDSPDQICALGDGIVLCQDSGRVQQQVLWWLSPGGKPSVFARNNTVLDGVDFRAAEWSGVCMSPDGKWLFANVYSPGYSVAITGPWESLRA